MRYDPLYGSLGVKGLNIMKLFMHYTSSCILEVFANLRVAYPRPKHGVLLNQIEISCVCTDADFG